MQINDLPESPRRVLRTTQIIVAALLIGALTITLVMVVLRHQRSGGLNPAIPNAPAPNQVPGGGSGFLLTPFALGIYAMALILAIFVPNLVVRGQIALHRRPPEMRQADDAEGSVLGNLDWLPSVHQIKMIVQTGILVGAIQLCAIVYLIEGTPLCLLAAVVLLLTLLAYFPTQARYDAWARKQFEANQLESQGSV